MRTNRFLAVLLAATMVFGSTVTAFAADPTQSATGSGTADGTGSSEGYVNTTVLKVVLPTTSATTFAFIMDPQEMLAQTNGARLGTAWTQPKNDTYVYFKTAKGYANESDTVYFINKSTAQKLDVTVNAKLSYPENTAADDKMGIGTSTTAKHSVTDAELLYLGLKAGGATSALTTDADGVDIIVKADNAPDEYTVAYNTKNKAYELAEKTGAAFQAVPISVEGSVTHKATEKVSPSLTLTWSWDVQSAGVTATTGAAAVNYVTSDAYTVTNATLDQTASGYGSFVNKIGPDKGGKLTINGTASSVITFANDIEKIQYRASSSGTFADVSNGVATFKGKAVTVKGSVWNATGDSAIPVGAQIQVVFKDPDNDNSTSNTPTAIIFEKL